MVATSRTASRSRSRSRSTTQIGRHGRPVQVGRRRQRVEVALSVEEGSLRRHDGVLLFVLNAVVARSLAGGPSTLLRANPRAHPNRVNGLPSAATRRIARTRAAARVDRGGQALDARAFVYLACTCIHLTIVVVCVHRTAVHCVREKTSHLHNLL